MGLRFVPIGHTKSCLSDYESEGSDFESFRARQQDKVFPKHIGGAAVFWDLCLRLLRKTSRRQPLRCRYKGEDGMKRWVGLGVISDNLINIGRAINEKSTN